MSHSSAKCGEGRKCDFGINVRALSFGFVLVCDPGRNFIYTMGLYGTRYTCTPNPGFDPVVEGAGNMCDHFLAKQGLGRLVALQKPNGRVLGLVICDPFRRLVARSLAQQFSQHVHTLSTRAGAEAVVNLSHQQRHRARSQ